MIDGTDERVNAAVLHAQAAQVLERFLFAQIDKLGFDPGTNHDRFGREMVPRVILNKIDILLCRAVAAIVDRGAGVTDPGYRREVALTDVARENRWLRGEKEKSACDCLLFRGKLCGDGRLSGI